MLADQILINVTTKILEIFFRFLSKISVKRYDLKLYHLLDGIWTLLGRKLNLITEINDLKFDASYKTPWLRAERLFTKEPDTINWINKIMVEGDIFFDIGANIGIYSIYAGSKGVKVFAFEP